MATRLRRHRKFRGARTHGRGKKAGRGKGKRGGTGLAGLHKHKWIWTLKYDRDHFGRHGFKRPEKMLEELTIINVTELEHLKAGEHVKVDKEKTVIDLVGLGIDKLLGSGPVRKRYEIVVDRASAKAIERVKAAGGKVTVNIQPKPEKPKDDKAVKGGGGKPAPADKGKEAKGGGGKDAPKQPKEKKDAKETANVKTPKPDAAGGGKGGEKHAPKPEKPAGK